MANEPMKRCSTPEVLRETNVTVRHTSEDGGDTGAGGGVEGAPPQAGRNGTWHGPPETAGGVRPGVAQGNRGTWPRGHLSGASAAAAAAQPTRELPGTDRRLSRPPAGRLREDDAERKDPEERRTSAQNARRRKLIYSDKKTRAAGSGGEAEGQRQGWVRGARRATSPSFCAPSTHQGVGRRWHLAEAV